MRMMDGRPLLKRETRTFETKAELDAFLAEVKAVPQQVAHGMAWSGQMLEDGNRFNLLVTGGRLQGERTELRIVGYLVGR